MACKCEKADGFKEKLGLAKKQTRISGETHVVYVHEAVNQAFIRKETELNSELGICCYFLPDGTEVEWTDKVAKEIKKKAVKQAKIDAENAKNAIENIEVVGASPEEIEAFVVRIKAGEKMDSPEDLQFYQNNAAEIEKQIKE